MSEQVEREFAAEIKEMGDKIMGMTLKEAKELSDYLKDVYGVEPAAGGAVMVFSCRIFPSISSTEP